MGSILQLANGRLDVLVLQIYRRLRRLATTSSRRRSPSWSSRSPTSSVGRAWCWSRSPTQQRASTSADAVRHFTLLGGAAAIANVLFGSALIVLGYGSRFHAAIAPMLILLPGVWMLGSASSSRALSGRGGRSRNDPGRSFRGGDHGAGLRADPSAGNQRRCPRVTVGYSTLGIVSVVVLHRVSAIPVRELAIPTRADLHGYRRFLTSVWAARGDVTLYARDRRRRRPGPRRTTPTDRLGAGDRLCSVRGRQQHAGHL